MPAGLTNVIAIAAGWSHSLALRRDGTVIGWGDNTYGQTNVPAALTNVVALAAKDGRSMAITAELEIFAIAKVEQHILLRFRAFSGRQYMVEYSPTLNRSHWTELPLGPFPGTGDDAVVGDTNVIDGVECRFYRVREVP